MSRRVCSSSAPKGSSISRIGVSRASARAMATRCRMPPESSRGYLRLEAARGPIGLEQPAGDLAALRGAARPASSRPNVDVLERGAPREEPGVLEHDAPPRRGLGPGAPRGRRSEHAPAVGRRRARRSCRAAWTCRSRRARAACRNSCGRRRRARRRPAPGRGGPASATAWRRRAPRCGRRSRPASYPGRWAAARGTRAVRPCSGASAPSPPIGWYTPSAMPPGWRPILSRIEPYVPPPPLDALAAEIGQPDRPALGERESGRPLAPRRRGDPPRGRRIHLYPDGGAPGSPEAVAETLGSRPRT